MNGATPHSAEARWTPASLQVGGWRITALYDATFGLDGGAMWGVVPKNLWARLTPPAEDNTIRLAARPFLAEKDGVKVVVDPNSLLYIDGTQMDFVKEGLNEGFKFTNPNSAGECGCGESFTV